jgi:hypothetical protein
MKTALLVLVLLTPLTLLAQEEPAEKLSHHALGLSASMLSAPGLSYQFIFNDDHRIKITAFGYYEKNQSNSSDLTAIAGGEYQVTLTRARSTRFYLEVGGYYWHEKNQYEYTTFPEETVNASYNKYTTLAAGAGIGVEVAIENHFLISIDGSLLYRNQKRSYSPERSSSYNSTPIEYFGPGIGFAAYYRF